MRFGVCLHGGTVARSGLHLHPTDRRAIELGLAAGAEVVIVEAVGPRGSAPTAVVEGMTSGAARAVRLVDAALDAADAHTTSVVLATAFDRLAVDLILFGDDADPEGVGDVGARVAHNMSAMYLTGVVDLKAPRSEDGADHAIDIMIVVGSRLCGVRVPLNAVVGIAPDGPRRQDATSPTAPASATAPEAMPAPRGVEVLSLDDLKLDPALVRRRHDGNGAIELASRPLVTLHSAAAIAALLRR